MYIVFPSEGPAGISDSIADRADVIPEVIGPIYGEGMYWSSDDEVSELDSEFSEGEFYLMSSDEEVEYEEGEFIGEYMEGEYYPALSSDEEGELDSEFSEWEFCLMSSDEEGEYIPCPPSPAPSCLTSLVLSSIQMLYLSDLGLSSDEEGEFVGEYMEGEYYPVLSSDEEGEYEEGEYIPPVSSGDEDTVDSINLSAWPVGIRTDESGDHSSEEEFVRCCRSSILLAGIQLMYLRD